MEGTVAVTRKNKGRFPDEPLELRGIYRRFKLRKKPYTKGIRLFTKVAARAGWNYELGHGKMGRYRGGKAP